jgi:predicted permease
MRRPSRRRAEIDEEIRNHIELRTRDLERAGLEPDAARAEAERRFGDLREARRRLYAAAKRSEDRLRFTGWLDALRMDVTTALRRIRATPGFSLLSVATFALGVGLTSTMFAVVNATVLRPLPYPEPDRLVALYSVDEDLTEFRWVSATNWLDWKEQNSSLAHTAMYDTGRISVATGGEATRVPVAHVGGPLFDVLQSPIVVGRAFTESEAMQQAPVAMVSEGFWRRALEADPDLGDILVNGSSRRVVGVVSARHAFPERTEIWIPAVYRRLSGAGRNNINWHVVARLAPEVTAVAARNDLDRIAKGIRDESPEVRYSWGVGVVPLKDTIVGNSDETLWLLMGAVVSVLLVACANLAGQAYARSLTRVDGAALRLALGSTRGRLLQHQLVEHLLLALGGGLAGLAVSYAVAGWIAAGNLPLPRADTVAIDLHVVAFAVVVSGIAGLLAGTIPALRVARAAPGAAMSSVRGAAGSSRTATAGVLVGVEIALSVLLLIGGGMLLQSFAEFTGRDLGFDPERILVAEIELGGPEYTNSGVRLATWERIVEEARALPGAAAAALANEVPGLGSSGNGWIALAERPDLEEASATYRVISQGYFETLGARFLAGRDFDSTDGPASARGAIVSRAFADRYWPGEDALGKQIRALSMEPGNADWLQVIGVVEDLDSGEGREQQPAMYVLVSQVSTWAPRRLIVTIRADQSTPAALARPLRESLDRVDSALAADVAPMVDHLDGIVARDRLVMSILNGFALLALGLAAIGVHGLLSFVVACRTREIAVRAALGAQRGRILGMVMAGAVRVAGVGCVVGMVGAWWLSGFLAAQFNGLSTRDPLVFVAVALGLFGVSAAAAWLPAMRAVRLDPLDALRSD